MSARPRDFTPDNYVRRAGSPRRDAAQLQKIHVAVAERLSRNGARYTNTRRTVVEILARARQPLTVEQLRGLSAAPLSSVYRTVAVLEEAELVHRFTNNNSEFARFELAEDLMGHHHHLACATCGTMTDVILPDRIEADLDRALALLAKKQHFIVDEHRLDIIGTCSTCSDDAPPRGQ
jgi:Fe2+ or Zn2+ uptake regulation protein